MSRRIIMMLLFGSASAISMGETPAPGRSTPAEKLDLAQGYIAANGGQSALDLLREVVSLRDQDAASAAMAQYTLGEYLLVGYRRANEAEPEFLKVLNEFPDQPAAVNAARVRLLQIRTFAKQWSEVPALAGRVVADGRVGLANNELVSRAYASLGYMYEALGKEAELNRECPEFLAYRGAAGDAYRDAAVWGHGTSAGDAALKSLVELFAHTHRFYGEELQSRASWLSRCKSYLASTLSGSVRGHEKQEPGKIAGVDAMARLGRTAELGRNRAEAIAWYRLVVAHPDRTADIRREASELIMKLFRATGRDREAEQWGLYLVSPALVDDPTAAIVLDQLGVQPTPAPPETMSEMVACQVTLGDLYRSQRRLTEARDLYLDARTYATTSREHLSCLVGLAYCTMRIEGKAASLPLAHEAVNHCLTIILGPHDGDAHYATYQAASVFGENSFDEEEVQILQYIAAMPELRHHPSRLAVAKYRLMREYISDGFYDEARVLGEEILDEFLDRSFGPGHSTLCTWTSLNLAYRYADLGDAEKVNNVLDKAALRFSGQYGRDIEIQRKILLDRLGIELNQ